MHAQPGAASSSSPTAAFFGDSAFSLCIAVFDTRRGQREGEQYEQVMGFFPTSAPITVRTAIVGLSQALTQFVGNFTQEDSGTAKVLDAQNSKWLSIQCEPSIWFLAVINKAWAGPSLTDVAVEALLRSLHATYTLLHGSISRLLEQDVSAYSVKRGLQPLLDEAGGRLARLETRERAALANPLGATHEGLPYLATTRRAFLAVQCLLNELSITSFYGTPLVAAALALHGDQVLWSGLGREDTQSVYHLAARVLAPVVGLNSYNKTSRSRSAPPDVQSDTPASPQHWTIVPPTSDALAPAPSGAASQTSASSAAAAAAPHPGGFLVCRLRPAAVSASSSGAQLASEGGAAGMSAVLQPLRLWLEGRQEWVLLLPYHHGPLLLILLLHDGVVLSSDVLAALTDVLTARCPSVAAQLAEDLPRHNVGGHYPGYRYSYVDDVCGATRASPARKVSTLSQQSMQLLADVRNHSDRWLAGPTHVPTLVVPPTSSSAAHPGEESKPPLVSSPAPIPAVPHGDTADSDNTTTTTTSEISPAPPAPSRPLSGAPGGVGGDKVAAGVCGELGDCELVLRGASRCWVVLRRAGGRRLHVVLESPPESGLVPVAKHVQALCNSAFPGAFL